MGNIYYTTIHLALMSKDDQTYNTVNSREGDQPAEYYYNSKLAERIRDRVLENYDSAFCSANVLNYIPSTYTFGLCIICMAFEKFVATFKPFKLNEGAAFNIRILAYAFLSIVISVLITAGITYAVLNHGANCGLSFYEDARVRAWVDSWLFFFFPGFTSFGLYLVIYLNSTRENPAPPFMKPMFVSCLFWIILCGPKFVHNFYAEYFLEYPYDMMSKFFYIWHNARVYDSLAVTYGVLNPIIYFLFYPGMCKLDQGCIGWVNRGCRKKHADMKFQTTEEYVNEINRFSGEVQLRMRTMRPSIYQ